MKVEMKTIVQDGIGFLVRYVYFIDGKQWEDQKNYYSIIVKTGKLGAGTSSGWNPKTVPVVMRT